MANSKICDRCGTHALVVLPDMRPAAPVPLPQIDPDAEDPARELLKMAEVGLRQMAPASLPGVYHSGPALPMGWGVVVLARGAADGGEQKASDLCGLCLRQVNEALKPTKRDDQ